MLKFFKTFIYIIAFQSTLYPSSYQAKRIPDRLSGKLLGITPLHCATSVQQAAEIISYAPDINAPDNEGFTPIQYMIRDKNFETACYLQNQKAQLTEFDMEQLSQYKKHKYMRRCIIINSFMYLTSIYINSK